MLTAIRAQNSDGILIYLNGDLDENCDLEHTIGFPNKDFQLNCRGILRINSAGVRNWMIYFRKLSNQERKVTFLECSPAFVMQMNLFPDFLCYNPVSSLYAPFFCSKCGKDTLQIIMKDDVGPNFVPEPIKCQHCSSQADFDDDPETYFQIWKKA
jgi:hypothetical protein